jgi:hypothetical protein
MLAATSSVFVLSSNQVRVSRCGATYKDFGALCSDRLHASADDPAAALRFDKLRNEMHERPYDLLFDMAPMEFDPTKPLGLLPNDCGSVCAHLGILAYGSLIDDPGEEIAAATASGRFNEVERI